MGIDPLLQKWSAHLYTVGAVLTHTKSMYTEGVCPLIHTGAGSLFQKRVGPLIHKRGWLTPTRRGGGVAHTYMRGSADSNTAGVSLLHSKKG